MLRPSAWASPPTRRTVVFEPAVADRIGSVRRSGPWLPAERRHNIGAADRRPGAVGRRAQSVSPRPGERRGDGPFADGRTPHVAQPNMEAVGPGPRPGPEPSEGASGYGLLGTRPTAGSGEDLPLLGSDQRRERQRILAACNDSRCSEARSAASTAGEPLRHRPMPKTMAKGMAASGITGGSGPAEGRGRPRGAGEAPAASCCISSRRDRPTARRLVSARLPGRWLKGHRPPSHPARAVSRRRRNRTRRLR